MKIKILKIMLCLILPCALICGGKDNQLYNQITLNEIYDAISTHAGKISDGFTGALFTQVDLAGRELDFIRWQMYFEREIVDATNFMMMDIIKLYGIEDIELYIFKFFDIAFAKNSYVNFGFGDEYSSKQYGNLVVRSPKYYATKMYNIIDGIGN